MAANIKRGPEYFAEACQSEHRVTMKILIVMNLPYYPARGGANKSNRIVAELLAARGHAVHVVAPALGVPPQTNLAELRSSLDEQGVRVEAGDTRAWRYEIRGVHLHAVTNRQRLRETLVHSIDSLHPEWVIVSSEEPSQNLLQAALMHAPGRVAYMLHTPNFLPFGPLAFYPGQKRAALVEKVTCVIAASQFSADYVSRWSSARTVACHLPVYGNGPFPLFETAGREFVTLVNPCRYKGIDIFASLAEALPDVAFAAVTSWGTTNADLERLRALPNVTIFPACDDIGEIFRRTKILLMPSLWLESFGLTLIEAMLRGIPVLAADVGGLPEAKLGTKFVLPVKPIERFSDEVDENNLPMGIVPEQDTEPWRDALEKLIANQELYAGECLAACAAATKFVEGLDISAFESILTERI
ncbi:MAG TPA: glycosyltransferase family 4 protein [Pyrinomonadaceae bacterium]|jgi:glycosyltransferase involved in cell wall biosynthesis|nr:glycosyltransferase family 4 protein [Pyrinomonadaceae bacterium]